MTRPPTFDRYTCARPVPPHTIPPVRRDVATVNRHRQVRPALGRVVAAIRRRRETA